MYLLGVLLLRLLGSKKVFAQNDFFYDIGNEAINNNNLNTEDIGGTIVASQSIDGDSTILTRLIDLFQLNPFTESTNSATAYIAYIINILLGLASLVALGLLLYGFYLMFFSKQEDGLARAKKILIGVVVALLILGLAWFIVALAFNIFQNVG